MVEADHDNRALEVVAESPDFYRSSYIQLEGAQAQRTSVVQFRNLPSGRYRVTGTLVGSVGPRAAVSRVFEVARSTGLAR
jgi:hypothetical protein